MPKVPNPDALGLNDNSAVLKHTADTEKLLQGVVLTSPASSSGKEAEEQGLRPGQLGRGGRARHQHSQHCLEC